VTPPPPPFSGAINLLQKARDKSLLSRHFKNSAEQESMKNIPIKAARVSLVASSFVAIFLSLALFERKRCRGAPSKSPKPRNWPRKPKIPSPTSLASLSKTTLISVSAPTTPPSGF
jgi:hypothetical protein